MKLDGALALIGFSQKGHMLAAGDANVEAYLEKKSVYLLLLATDLSEQKKIGWKMRAEEMGIPIYELTDKLTMGLAVGMSPRVVLAITDGKMAKAIEAKINE